MRCEEVIEELAAPTDMRDAASLAIHLSRCPYCAAWAKRAAKLDNLWQRTAPTAPAPHVWDILWSSVTSSLDSSADKEIASSTVLVSRNGSANGFLVRPETKLVNRPFSPSVRSRRWKVIGLVGLAQAAAVLLVAGLAWRFFIPPHLFERIRLSLRCPCPQFRRQLIRLAALYPASILRKVIWS